MNEICRRFGVQATETDPALAPGYEDVWFDQRLLTT